MDQNVRVAIALGSNLGDRVGQLSQAVRHLESDLLNDLKASSVYETEPVGFGEQPRFLNAVVTGVTEWKPPAIINYLKNLEADLGRVASVPNGPRCIDLDLLIYNDSEWNSEGVEVPHPRLTEREFVLVPLAEIWNDWKHPQLRLSVHQLLIAYSKNQPLTAKKISAPLLNTENQ